MLKPCRCALLQLTELVLCMTSQVYRPRKPKQAFPKTCKGGVIDLQGVYEVKEDTTIRGCNLQGSGAKSATILLRAHLIFAPELGCSRLVCLVVVLG